MVVVVVGGAAVWLASVWLASVWLASVWLVLVEQWQSVLRSFRELYTLLV